MSEENVEIVRRVYEGWARGDFSEDEVFHPEIEFHAAKGFPGPESYHGHQEHLAYVKRWLESWDEYRTTPVDFIEAGDQVVVIYRAAGRGKRSGIEVESRQAHLWTIRAGKAVRFEVFSRPDEALEAAGLRE